MAIEEDLSSEISPLQLRENIKELVYISAVLCRVRAPESRGRDIGDGEPAIVPP